MCIPHSPVTKLVSIWRTQERCPLLYQIICNGSLAALFVICCLSSSVSFVVCLSMALVRHLLSLYLSSAHLSTCQLSPVPSAIGPIWPAISLSAVCYSLNACTCMPARIWVYGGANVCSDPALRRNWLACSLTVGLCLLRPS